MAKQGQQQKPQAKTCPYPVGLFAEQFKVTLDTVSRNKEKADRSRTFLDPIKKAAVLAETRYNDAKSQGKAGLELENLQYEYLYTARLDAIQNLYINRFGTMQTWWHAEINRIEAKYSSKKKNGGWMKTATDIGIAAITTVLANASGLLDGLKTLFTVKMPHFLNLHLTQANEDLMKLGAIAIALTGVFAVVQLVGFAKKLYNSRIENKEKESISQLFMEEGPVTRAIEQIVRQRVLGLCAKYGYRDQLVDYEDPELLRLSNNKKNASDIRKLIIQRVNDIKQNVPQPLRQLLGGPHLLPDYLEEVKKEQVKANASSENALSGFVARVFEAILSKGKVKA